MFAAGITSHPIAVDFLTSSYRIVGKVMVAHTGLLGLMAASNTSIIDIQEAQLARLDNPNKLADRFDIARLVKQQVVAASVSRRDDLGPLVQMGLNSYNRYPIYMTTPDFEINGILEWNGRFDVGAILGQGTGEFFPLYRASLSAIFVPGLQMDMPVALINRRFIDLIALSVQQKLEEY